MKIQSDFKIRDLHLRDQPSIENLYKSASLLDSSNIIERIKNFSKNGGIVELKVWDIISSQNCKCLIAENQETITACYSCLLNADRYKKLILSNKDLWMSMFPESLANLQDWISKQKLIAGSFDGLVNPNWRRQKILCHLKREMSEFLMKRGFKYMFIEIYEFEQVFKGSDIVLSNIYNAASINFHAKYMKALEIGYLPKFFISIDDVKILVKPRVFLSDIQESSYLLTNKLLSIAS